MQSQPSSRSLLAGSRSNPSQIVTSPVQRCSAISFTYSETPSADEAITATNCWSEHFEMTHSDLPNALSCLADSTTGCFASPSGCTTTATDGIFRILFIFFPHFRHTTFGANYDSAPRI